MTIYETLKQLVNHDIKTGHETVQFQDVIKQMEKIRGKRYYIFEYKDIEKVLKIFKVEIKLPVFNSLRQEAELFLKTGDYEPLMGNASVLKSIYDYPNGTMLDTKNIPCVIHGWKEFKSVLKSHMDNAL